MEGHTQVARESKTLLTCAFSRGSISLPLEMDSSLAG